MRYLLAAMTALGLAVGNQALAAEPHTTDTLEQVKKAVADGKAVIVDVREPAEFVAGHLKNAVFLPLSMLKSGANKPELTAEIAKQVPKDKIMYCHCKSGGRVLPASEILRKLGYDVRPLKAGYDELLQAGFAGADTNKQKPK